jgi:hypothetical protein
MTTQNEKNARKTLVLQEILEEIIDYYATPGDGYPIEVRSKVDAEKIQLMLVERGYLVMAL